MKTILNNTVIYCTNPEVILELRSFFLSAKVVGHTTSINDIVSKYLAYNNFMVFVTPDDYYDIKRFCKLVEVLSTIDEGVLCFLNSRGEAKMNSMIPMKTLMTLIKHSDYVCYLGGLEDIVEQL